MLNLYSLAQDFERTIAKLQQQVLQIRMVPLGQMFGKLSQILRRSSKSLGKKINLAVFGEHTEIDKHIAEEVMDPLVHIMRNAIDHGIEPARERASAGKEKAGNIKLKAFQRGNNVVIEISDDGRGIDAEMIRRKAMEGGLLKDGDALSDQEGLDILFPPGFSTKESASEVSGRGVGLDIVREKLSSLGGAVEVKSEPGVGTTFTLILPITLAIVKALLVRVGSQKFAVPLSSISETVSVEQDHIRKRENRDVYILKDEILPVETLKDMFELPGHQADRPFVVVVGHGKRRRGFVVDELLGQSEVVIKSLGGYFEGLRGIAGAAEIGKDEVILVLDVESLIEESMAREGAAHV
jgi:two-component system chemotaxis sensor kinase CheA